MSADYDPEEFDLCGVLYKATRQQANEIFSIVVLTGDWQDYATTNDLLRYGDFSATDPVARKLVEQHVANYRKAFKTVKKIVETYFADAAS